MFSGISTTDVVGSRAVASSCSFVRLSMSTEVSGLLIVVGAKLCVTRVKVVRGKGSMVSFQVAIGPCSPVMSIGSMVMRTNQRFSSFDLLGTMSTHVRVSVLTMGSTDVTGVRRDMIQACDTS